MSKNGQSTRWTRFDRPHVEILEPRYLLSGTGLPQSPLDESFVVDVPADEDLPGSDEDSTALCVHPDAAPAEELESFHTAAAIRAERNLGAFTGRRSFSGHVGWNDTSDTVQFTLRQRSSV